MEFLKKHYEKILLSVVLLGLAAVAAFLPIKVSQEQQALQTTVPPSSPKPYTSVNLTNFSNTLQQVEADTEVSLAGTHNLFNPVQWQIKLPQGNLYKLETGEETGVQALTVTNIAPLYFTVEFKGVQTVGGDLRYRFGVTDEASPNQNLRRELPRFLSPQDPRNPPLLLKEVIGDPANPDTIVLELLDSNEEIRVTSQDPFRRVDGYMADLRYEPENRNARNARVGNWLPFQINGNWYKIVAITDKDVTVSAASSNIRTTISYTGAP